MRLRVHHHTEYRYMPSVTRSSNELRLRPVNNRFQHCESFIPSVLPPARVKRYEDLYYNPVLYFELPEAHDRLIIDSRATVETRSRVDLNALPYGMSHEQLEKCLETEVCYPFLQNSQYVEATPEIWRSAVDIRDQSSDVFQTSYAIMDHIFRNFEYQSGSTLVSTHANEVFEQRRGVCQDFAHVMLAMLRSLEIPARYVSGYLFDATRDRSLRGSEASHAWVEVFLLDHGWVGLDPTNNKVVDDTYITLATGRDYGDVAPVQGTYFGSGNSFLHVTVTVSRLD